MALSDRINDKFDEWKGDITRGLAAFVVTVLGKGIELTLDIVGRAMKPTMLPLIDKMMDQPDMPDDIKTILNDLKIKDGQWQAMLLGGLGGSAIGGAASSALLPGMEKIKHFMSRKDRFQIFDYPVVLGAWLRDKEKYSRLFRHLEEMGYEDEDIEMLKELAYIVPPLPDMTRFADFGAFDPEIIEKWRDFYNAPSWIQEPMAKIGVDSYWADKYWFSHWVQPGRYELGLMRARDYIGDDDVRKAYLTQGYSAYWQDLLLKLVWQPYTRVDVRRMYREGVLDREGVKRTYKDLGYDEEHAENLTEFTVRYYSRPESTEEDAVDREIERNRDLTRSDITDGYRKKLIDEGEARTMLGLLGYDADEVDFYIKRENYKADQELKTSYSARYKSQFINGAISADQAKSEMGDLGFESEEIDELLKFWHIDRTRRAARPSRADLDKFLKAGIITQERYRQEMALDGYSDEYIDWYLKEME